MILPKQVKMTGRLKKRRYAFKGENEIRGKETHSKKMVYPRQGRQECKKIKTQMTLNILDNHKET